MQNGASRKSVTRWASPEIESPTTPDCSIAFALYSSKRSTQILESKYLNKAYELLSQNSNYLIKILIRNGHNKRAR
ncbi:conserved protein of unknown function [Ectopseudomonas oleovorans]|nr:conserved protein of unknown function [Pseudomonas oleovorans]VXB29400.1 hypothetical protein PSEUDO8O_120801 [Pseudomonas sp. 8O]